MTCTCEWMWRYPSLADPTASTEPYWLLHRRHPACPTHGDNTPWWERTQARAAELGARIVGAS